MNKTINFYRNSGVYYMDIFNVEKYNEMKLDSTTIYGKTYTTIKIHGQLSHYKYMDLTMYDNNNKILAFIYTTIFNNKIHILDFISYFEDFGNGKQLLKNLITIAKDISNEYPIYKIDGMLSSVDFENRHKLIHIYSTICHNAIFYINNGYSISQVLNDSSKHFGFTIDISCIHSKK